jgi:hypothetical protein
MAAHGEIPMAAVTQKAFPDSLVEKQVSRSMPSRSR